MRVLLTGATGALGPSVARVLMAHGHEVRALVRPEANRSALPAGLALADGDLGDPPSLVRAVDGADAVVHLAALLHITNPPPALLPRYELLNVAATRTLLDAARAAGAQRFVFASTIAVYGDTTGRIADESTPVAPEGPYARTKYEAERLVLTATRADGAPLGVALRLSAVYGGRVKGNYRRLVHALDRGRFVAIGAGENRRSLVHEQDAARAMAVALDHPAAAGGVFNVTDGTPHRVREIIAAICAALNRPAPAWSLPVPLARVAAIGAEAAGALLRRTPPISREAIRKYLEHAAVDGSRIERMLGFRAGLTLADGWREAIETLRAAGDLRPARAPRQPRGGSSRV